MEANVSTEWKVLQIKHALGLKDAKGNLHITGKARDVLKERLNSIVKDTMEKGVIQSKFAVLRSVMGFEEYERSLDSSVPEELQESELLKKYLDLINQL